MFGGNTVKKRLLSIVIVSVLVISMVGSNAFVVNTKALSREKIISEFVDGAAEGVKQFKKTHIKNSDGSKTVISEKYKKKRGTKKKTNIPSSYVAPYTSVKNQAYFGCCWMFGEIASLESNLMNKESYQGGLSATDPIDLSEAQGVYTQYHQQTTTGTIVGEFKKDSENDCEIYHDDYYGFNEGGWQYDASMAMTADKASALEDDNPYISTSRSSRRTDSKTMSEIAAANYKLNRFNIESAEGLPEVFPVLKDEYENEYREYYPEVRSIWKEKIINNGAISANYWQTDETTYNHTWGYKASQYALGPNFWKYDSENLFRTNHVISIVGYNDNYSRYHFIDEYTSQDYDSDVAEVVYIKTDSRTQPEMTFNEDGSVDSIETSPTYVYGYKEYIVPKEDGAWTIKNSYGTVDGTKKKYDDGIMYMSYCEETLSECVSSVVEEDIDDIQNDERVYDTTLSHSSLMGNTIEGLDSDAKAAEIYSIKGENDIELDQIGYWTGEADTTSRFKVYGNLTNTSNPEDGTLLFDSGEVTNAYKGYHTIELDEEIILEAGTKACVVTTQKSGGESALMIESDGVSDPYYTINCKEGDTKYYYDNQWNDATEFDDVARGSGLTVGNSTVKLFGNEVTPFETYTVTVDGVETEVEEGDDFTFPTTAENGYVSDDYSTLYASGQTITPDSDITATSIGDIDLTIDKGASIDLTGQDGIRFLANASYDDSDLLESDNVELGTMIAPYDVVTEIYDYDLDLDSQEQLGDVARVVNNGWNQGVVGQFSAGVTSMKSYNWDREFMAKSYMILKYSDGSQKTFYTGFSGERSIVGVAEDLRDAGYPGMTEEQIANIQKYLQ